MAQAATFGALFALMPLTLLVWVYMHPAHQDFS